MPFLIHGISVFWLAVCLTILGGVAVAQNAEPDYEATTPIRVGRANAPVKIDVFYDLQCPLYSGFHLSLKEVEKKYGESLLITFWHFPLNIPAHDKAILAARAVEAARLQGKGLEMLDLILLNQRKWSAANRAQEIFFGYASTLKLRPRKFREDFESDFVIRRIMNDSDHAKSLKLNWVPTVFVNGKNLEPRDFGTLAKIIEQLVR
jgi:protein-disulfide isomerase